MAGLEPLRRGAGVTQNPISGGGGATGQLSTATFLPASPDIIGALISRLRSAPPLQNYIATNGQVRVSASLNPTWQMPDYAIVLRKNGGGGGDPETGRLFQSFVLRCYGAGKTYATRERTADELWRWVDAYLCPTPQHGVPMGFIAAHCLVYSIAREAMPTVGNDPDADQWARTVNVYTAVYGAVPV